MFVFKSFKSEFHKFLSVRETECLFHDQLNFQSAEILNWSLKPAITEMQFESANSL